MSVSPHAPSRAGISIQSRFIDRILFDHYAWRPNNNRPAHNNGLCGDRSRLGHNDTGLASILVGVSMSLIAWKVWIVAYCKIGGRGGAGKTDCACCTEDCFTDVHGSL